MRFRLPRVLAPLRAVPEVVGHSGSVGAWLFHCAERDLFLCGTVDQTSGAAVPFGIMPGILRGLA
jgi:D-alanyl-D-alanine carboxypeptidase